MLAIVVPYYKLTFFKKCLESLAEQTDQRFTVYIGDDASPENPEELLKEFEGKFNFVYKKFQENFGVTSLTKQWERCIDMMKGEEWFMILGDDDFLGPNCVKGFYRAVVNPKFELKVLRFNFQVINEFNVPTSEEVEYVDEETSVDFIVKRKKGLVRNSLSEYVFRTRDYRRYGIMTFPKAFYSDNMMVMQYSDFGAIKNISLDKVSIRISEISVTGNGNNLKYLAEAEYFFYTHLITKYKDHFTKIQRVNFLPPLFTGYLLKKTNVKFLEVYKIVWGNTNLLGFAKICLRHFKFKIKNLLQK